MNNQYKLEYNDKIKEMYENKLNEYKQKIIILKKRINELLGVEMQSNNNYFYNRGNSARYGHQNLNNNIMKKNRSFKYNKHMNILTDFNFYNEKNKPTKDYRKIYANFKTKNYCLMCDDNHKNIYMSFEDLIENANKIKEEENKNKAFVIINQEFLYSF